MQTPCHTLVRFGSFELDLSAGELRLKGIRIKLQEQPFRILVALLERPGEMVTREQLRECLWATDTFVDFEHSLNAAVKKLRQALRDDAESPRFIETLPKRGYRFIAPVEANGGMARPAEGTGTPQQAQSTPWQWPISGRSALLAGAVVALMLVTSVTTTFWRRSGRIASAQSRVMLAVLPFDNLSSEPTEDYFAEGMTEELITQLGGWNPERLGVIARTSSDLYKGANKNVAQVGRELGVEYVVEGSARREGSQVRITAQLIRVRDQTHVWAKEYDRDERNVLALENEVASDVAGEISVKLSSTAKAQRPPVDATAHEEYLKGQHYWNQLSCKGFRTALPLLADAVRRDPSFAIAEASLADTYYKLADFGCIPQQEATPKARQAAEKAIQLDPQLGEAHAALGIVASQLSWDWATGRRELKMAVELGPNNAVAHSWHGALLCELREWDPCIAEQKAAHELDPVAQITNGIGAYMLYLNHRYDDAIEGWRRTLELHPDADVAVMGIALAYEAKVDAAKAAETYLRLRKDDGTPPAQLKRIQAAIQQEGLRGYWHEELNAVKASTPPDYCYITEIHAHLQDREETLSGVERNYEQHCRGIAKLNIDPIYDFVRQEPRFQAVLRKVGFPN